MIWSSGALLQKDQDALCDYLADQIAAASSSFSPSQAREIARGVTAYCSGFMSEQGVSSDYMALLLSRALWCLGEKDLARDLVDRQHLDSKQVDLFLSSPEGAAVSVDTWSLMDSRLVRPSQWDVENQATVWVLDFARIKMAPDDFVELVFLQGLRILLERTAEIWDATGGQGVLGLKGLREWLAVRKKAGPRSTRASMEEIGAFCRDVMMKNREKRAWAACPRVIHLDIPSRRRRTRTS